MQSTKQIKKILAALRKRMAQRTYLQFSCGDCHRNAQCGLPPHDNCVYRLMQMARDRDRPLQRHKNLYQAVWPVAGGRHESGH